MRVFARAHGTPGEHAFRLPRRCAGIGGFRHLPVGGFVKRKAKRTAAESFIPFFLSIFPGRSLVVFRVLKRQLEKTAQHAALFVCASPTETVADVAKLVRYENEPPRAVVAVGAHHLGCERGRSGRHEVVTKEKKSR